jgi:stage III sporulation protein AH
VKELMGLTKRMEQEKELEGLILAKGYKEAAAFVQPNAVTVVVRAAQITPEDAARITDLAVRSTGRPAEQVSIIAK